MKSVQLFILVISVCNISCQYFAFLQNCDFVPIASNFDPVQFSVGKWYEMYRVENIFQEQGRCGQLQTTINTNSTTDDKTVLDLVYKQISGRNKIKSITGSAWYNTGNEGKLRADLDMFSSVIFNILYDILNFFVSIMGLDFSELFLPSNLHVISVDHESYAVIGSCIQLPFGIASFKFLWLFARNLDAVSRAAFVLTVLLPNALLFLAPFKELCQHGEACPNLIYID